MPNPKPAAAGTILYWGILARPEEPQPWILRKKRPEEPEPEPPAQPPPVKAPARVRTETAKATIPPPRANPSRAPRAICRGKLEQK